MQLRQFFGKFHRDNKGSSLLLVIIAIAFVGILLSIIMVSSITGYRMKIADSESKKTFYDADSVLDEIYTILGQNCNNSLSKAYTEVSGKLMNEYGYAISNEELNSEMKVKFLEIIAKEITKEGTLSTINNTGYVDNFCEYITDALNADANTTVSVGGITYDSIKEKINIIDLKVECNNAGYVSSVTTDLHIGYPDMTIVFVKEGDDIYNYCSFAMIGLDGVLVGTNDALYTWATVDGSVYAGGLTVNPFSKLEMSDGMLINYGVFSQSRKTKGGALEIKTDSAISSGNTTVNLNDVTVWTQNIIVGSDGSGISSASAVLNATNTVFYVQDDLTIEGNYARVDIGGSYYGYSKNTRLLTEAYALSSAMIVNGKYNSLNLACNNLLIAGFAHIRETGYETKDALGIKGMQELYMVPAKYLSNNSNPSLERADTVDLTDFFAYKKGWVTGVSSKTVNISVNGTVTQAYYYYLVFADEASEIAYLNAIRSYNDSVAGYSAKEREDLNTLKRLLEQATRLFGSVVLQANNLKTNGNVYQFPANSFGTGNGSVTLPLEDGDNYKSTDEYYSIIASYLAFSSTYYLDGTDIYTRTVDIGAVEKLNASVSIPDFDYGYDGVNELVTVVTAKDTVSPYIIDYETPMKGVVLAYGVDVEVRSDFEGLIITNKTIQVTGNVELTANDALVRGILKSDACKEVAKYFRNFSGMNLALTPEDVGVEDMITFTNWRKNYVEE